MNPSTALATVVVDELVRSGVREAVVSPGSRNAPLSFALHAADAAGRLRLHVRIDERTAGFLALGLMGSLLVGYRIAEREYAARPHAAFAPWAGLCLLLWLTAMWLLAQPMEMRGSMMGM